MSDQPDLTRNQSLVLGALARADGPRSAYELLDDLRDDGLRAPLQVYRALDKLLELRLAHRLESLNAFVACGEPNVHEDGGIAAFAICEKCGRVEEFCDDAVCGRLGAIAHETGFRPRRTTIEIRGLCRTCAEAG